MRVGAASFAMDGRGIKHKSRRNGALAGSIGQVPIVAIALLAALPQVGAAPVTGMPALEQKARSRPPRSGRFGLSLQAFLDDAQQPSARVTVDVPYQTLVFFKQETGYRARFDVTVRVSKNGGGNFNVGAGSRAASQR